MRWSSFWASLCHFRRRGSWGGGRRYHSFTYLFDDDDAAAAKFMQGTYGFTLGYTSPAPAGGLARAQLIHGSGIIILGHAGEGALSREKSAGKLPALHDVVVVDVDAHCKHARAAGANVLLEPAEEPWGDRMYYASDHEGQFRMFAKHLAR